MARVSQKEPLSLFSAVPLMFAAAVAVGVVALDALVLHSGEHPIKIIGYTFSISWGSFWFGAWHIARKHGVLDE